LAPTSPLRQSRSPGGGAAPRPCAGVMESPLSMTPGSEDGPASQALLRDDSLLSSLELSQCCTEGSALTRRRTQEDMKRELSEWKRQRGLNSSKKGAAIAPRTAVTRGRVAQRQGGSDENAFKAFKGGGAFNKGGRALRGGTADQNISAALAKEAELQQQSSSQMYGRAAPILAPESSPLSEICANTGRAAPVLRQPSAAASWPPASAERSRQSSYDELSGVLGCYDEESAPLSGALGCYEEFYQMPRAPPSSPEGRARLHGTRLPERPVPSEDSPLAELVVSLEDLFAAMATACDAAPLVLLEPHAPAPPRALPPREREEAAAEIEWEEAWSFDATATPQMKRSRGEVCETPEMSPYTPLRLDDTPEMSRHPSSLLSILSREDGDRFCMEVAPQTGAENKRDTTTMTRGGAGAEDGIEVGSEAPLQCRLAACACFQLCRDGVGSEEVIRQHRMDWPAQTILDAEDHLCRAFGWDCFVAYDRWHNARASLAAAGLLLDTALTAVPEYPADWPQWKIDSFDVQEAARAGRALSSTQRSGGIQMELLLGQGTSETLALNLPP